MTAIISLATFFQLTFAINLPKKNAVFSIWRWNVLTWCYTCLWYKVILCRLDKFDLSQNNVEVWFFFYLNLKYNNRLHYYKKEIFSIFFYVNSVYLFSILNGNDYLWINYTKEWKSSFSPLNVQLHHLNI